MNLSKDVKISIAVTPTAGAAGTSAIEGATLDMAGFESVLMIVPFGAIVSGAVTSIKAQHGDAAASEGDIAESAQTIADDDDNKTFYIDLAKVTKRYVRLYISRATQNATVGGATYIQYNPKKLPVTHGSDVSGELHAGPSTGTA